MELARSRHIGGFIVIVEGTLGNCLASRGAITEAKSPAATTNNGMNIRGFTKQKD
jgi:hypothetical protein